MTRTAKRRLPAPADESGRRWSGPTRRVLIALVGIGVLSLVGTYLWRSGQNDTAMTDRPVPIGATVNSVQLEDSRSGQMFDLGQYLGKRDVVIVAYMGEFCPGCSELVGELQRRAPEFEAANAQLVVLGYEVGKTGRETAAKHGVTSYPLLQEGAPNTFTRSIGMWSDMMGMPWMGYVIIDKSGKIVSGEQTGLSEARGAAPTNVDKLLKSLLSTRASVSGG